MTDLEWTDEPVIGEEVVIKDRADISDPIDQRTPLNEGKYGKIVDYESGQSSAMVEIYDPATHWSHLEIKFCHLRRGNPIAEPK